jgi:hypothetical protein
VQKNLPFDKIFYLLHVPQETFLYQNETVQTLTCIQHPWCKNKNNGDILTNTSHFFLVGFYVAQTQDMLGHMAAFQLYRWRKTSGAPLCIIQGSNEHQSRTTNVR